MRGVLLSTLLLSLLASAALQADPRDDAVAILKAAIKAQGGAAALTRAATFQRYGSGTLILPATKQDFTDIVVAKLPARLRVGIDVEKRLQITMIVDGKKGWKASGGTTVELTGAGLEEFQEEAHVLWLTTLVPLLGDGFTLTPAGTAQRDGKAVVGVKVASQGHADAILWFDKDTKMLAFLEKDARLAGMKVHKTYGYAAYQEFAGVKLPTRIAEKVGDRTVTEATITDYRFPEKLADTYFTRP